MAFGLQPIWLEAHQWMHFCGPKLIVFYEARVLFYFLQLVQQLKINPNTSRVHDDDVLIVWNEKLIISVFIFILL